ncbi:cellulose binding domain-containing protein [Actinoplanes sp. NPDC049668]|uniref:cellulose binding domain-containing protein n=1 Tax=unclassified Actinoplanes TaxID=2626549 RepID=UPI0033BB880C
MSAKHSTPYPLRRYGFIGGASTLLVVMVAWVAVRAVGPTQDEQLGTPLMVQPTIAVAETDNGPTVIPWGSPAPSGSQSAAPTLSVAQSASPTPSKSSAAPTTTAPRTATPKPNTPKPTEKATTKPAPPPPASFTARYSVGASWDRGFVAMVRVTNTGTTARNWTVTISYESRAEVRITNAWNAQLDRQGDTSVLTGGPLAPGASFSFGFEASKQVRNRIQPTGCTVDGTPCRLD